MVVWLRAESLGGLLARAMIPPVDFLCDKANRVPGL